MVSFLLTLRSVRAGKHHKSGGEAAQGQRRMALREREREKETELPLSRMTPRKRAHNFQ